MDTNFVNTCRQGNLADAQLILRSNPNVLASAYDAFMVACCAGQLHVAQWLLQVKSDIDISAHYERIFRWTCSNNQLQVAQWLIHIKPDINISALNDYPYNRCRKCWVQVANWLETLMPFRYRRGNIIKNDVLLFILYVIVKNGYANYLFPNILTTLSSFEPTMCVILYSDFWS